MRETSQVELTFPEAKERGLELLRLTPWFEHLPGQARLTGKLMWRERLVRPSRRFCPPGLEYAP
jgi:hypothetical protein